MFNKSEELYSMLSRLIKGTHRFPTAEESTESIYVIIEPYDSFSTYNKEYCLGEHKVNNLTKLLPYIEELPILLETDIKVSPIDKMMYFRVIRKLLQEAELSK